MDYASNIVLNQFGSYLLVTTRKALAMQSTAQLYIKKTCDWEDDNKPHLLRQGA